MKFTPILLYSIKNCARCFPLLVRITHFSHVCSVFARYFLVFSSSPSSLSFICQRCSHSNRVVHDRRAMAKNASRKMKAVNSSSSSLLHITIPQFQQLLPLETSLSGTSYLRKASSASLTATLMIHLGRWVNSSESLSTANKLLSPPISITPSSICTGKHR